MTPQSEHFVAKAQETLAQADVMVTVSLYDAAGRAAYFAAFHAAQAYLFEMHQRVFKTHQGVHTEFSRLAKDDPKIDPWMIGFLSRSFDLKSIADYDTDPSRHVTAEQVKDALAKARVFVETIVSRMGGADRER